MIYVDTSVVLAQLLAEDKRPDPALWRESLVSSRLLEYEVWASLNSRGRGVSHGAAARDLIGRLALVEMAPPVLARALEPFPISVRTLDALHLASLEFLRGLKQEIQLASYDHRMLDAAARLGFAIFRI